MKKGDAKNSSAARAVVANFAIALDVIHRAYCRPQTRTRAVKRASELREYAERKIYRKKKKYAARFGIHFEKLNKIAKLINAVDHGNEYRQSPQGLSEFCASLSICLAALVANDRQQGVPRQFRIAFSRKRSALSGYDFTKANSHDDRAIQGCLRFLIGFYLESGGSAGAAFSSWSDLSKDFSADGFSARGGRVIRNLIDDQRLWGNLKRETSHNKRNILLIDDTAADDGWLDALRFAFSDCHFVHLGQNVDQDLLKKFVLENAKSSDIVLLDLQLPPPRRSAESSEPWGLELLKAMRKPESGVDCPIIVFSAYDAVLWSRRCHALGAQAVFTKFGSIQESDIPSTEFFSSYYRTLKDHLHLHSPDIKRSNLYNVVYKLGSPGRYRLLNRWEWAKRAVAPLGIVNDDQSAADVLARYILNELSFILDMVWIAEDVHAAVLARELFNISRHSSRARHNDVVQDLVPRELAVLGAASIERLLKLLIDITRATSREELPATHPDFVPSLGNWLDYVEVPARRFFPRLQGGSFIKPCRKLSQSRNAVLYSETDTRVHPDYIFGLVEKIATEISVGLESAATRHAP